MTRPHQHGDDVSPDEDAAIADEAMLDGDYKHAAGHLAAALAADPGRAAWLALVDRLLKGAADPLATVPVDGEKAPYFGTVALRGLLEIRLGRPLEGLELLFSVLVQRPQCTGYIAWVLDAVKAPGVLEKLGIPSAIGVLGGLLRSAASGGELPNPQEILAAYEPMIREFTRAFPGDAMLHLAAAYLLRRAAKPAEAEAMARVALRLRPDALSAAACASAMRDAGRLDDSLAMFRKGLELDPAADEVRLDLADTLLDAGRTDEAAREYETVLQRNPDHPWALPSDYYCRWQLTNEGTWLQKLQDFALGQPENSRASDLLARCKPYEVFLPGPREATVNIIEQVLAKGVKGLKTLGTSSLEAPSVHLCMQRAFGHDLHISVPGLQDPNPTVPRGPVKHVLWKYDSNLDPKPQGPSPPPQTSDRIAAIARQPYDREAWWSAAHSVATEGPPPAFEDVAAVMVHPPPDAEGFPSWIWIHRVQVAAAFVAAHVSWKDLLDIARGPVDWTVEAAVIALARLTVERREAQDDVLSLFRELGSSIPRPGYCCYEYALWCVLPWLPNAPAEEKAEAMRRRGEIERDWATPDEPPVQEEPVQRRLEQRWNQRDAAKARARAPAKPPFRWKGMLVVFGVVVVIVGLIAAIVLEEKPKESLRIRTPEGRALTTKDLETLKGRFNWEIIGHDQVPAEAEALHQRARAAGGKGDYGAALKDLAEAQRLAPTWPYPTYDMAWTYLLQGNTEKAAESYAKVVELAPRGFFTALTALDCLQREKKGEFPPGLYKNFVMLEWMGEAEKKKLLAGIVDKAPGFGPAWSELAFLTEDDAARLTILEKGLAASPDAETKGILLINKALLLSRQNRRTEAISILAVLVSDRSATLAVNHLARLAMLNLGPKR